MTSTRNPSQRNPGRVAGLWYLLLVFLGPLRLIYIPNKLFVSGDATTTASNIAAHEWLFRFGIVADLLGAVVLIFLTLALYRLFSGVDRNLAVQVVIFGGVMPALIYFVGVVSDFGADLRARSRLPHGVRQTSAGCAGYALPSTARPPEYSRRDPLGSVAHSVGDSDVPLAFHAPLPGSLACHQRVGLRRPQLHRNTLPAVPGRRVHLLPTSHVR